MISCHFITDAGEAMASEREKDDIEQEFLHGRPIRIPIEDSIDLHTFLPRDIPFLLEDYISECLKAGIYEVRIIHGKGKGLQRKVVRSFLRKSRFVDSFHEAPREAGGWGATIAKLKNR